MGQEQLQEKHQIKVGEQVELLSNTYEFIGVTMDSRCPKDVTCVMAGWAMIEVKVTQHGEAPVIQTVKIPATIPSNQNPELLVMENGARILAGVLTPYPVSTQTMEEREYCLELWVMGPA